MFIDDTPEAGAEVQHTHSHEGSRSRHWLGSDEADKRAEEKDATISIGSNSKQVEKMISPFFAKHIPGQYNPLGEYAQPFSKANKSSTKYCYRHRPDLKCRRQADEPSMEQLQSELGTLSQSDQQAISHVWSLFSAAPAKHRNLMLQGVLAQCCFPQLSYISSSVRELIKIDFISALPAELGFKILSFLDTTSLCKAAQVSQRWRSLADDDVVWHRMCEQHIDRKCTKCGWGLPLLERKRLRTEKRQIQLRATGRGLNESPVAVVQSIEAAPQDQVDIRSREPSAGPLESSISAGMKRPSADAAASPELSFKRACTQSIRRDSSQECRDESQSRVRPWKDVYKDRFKVGTNWKYGRYSEKVFKGHTNGIMCLQLEDNILATGSYDSTIKIWDLDSGEEIRTLTGHTAGVRCLRLEGCTLFSGSLDRTVKVWNWRTGVCKRTLTGHSGGIIGLDYDASANTLATGSMDKTIRIWNFSKSGTSTTFLFKGHTDWVNAVKIDGASRTVFSASDDCTVRLWDLDTRRCIKVYEGHVGQVQQVLPLPPEFELEDDNLEGNAHSDDEGSSTTSSSRHHSVTDAQLNPSPPPPPATFSSANGAATVPPLFHSSDPDRAPPPKYMLTGALDSTLRLWHTASGRCIRTYFGHIEGIWALAADTLRIVSGAEDRSVKIWDPRSGECERTIARHRAPVTCVGLRDWGFATGGEDCEVRVYSFRG
ncbi:hypothetical protein H2201_007517 [Coniosporium apollinis]|uniref:F-box domain-containing protein n=1 Tax=Coniosporium apollinis TaxID=61459 RepID=A0ABQ9NMA7_9PEZI|nr:hypothetical protein H2201_007517 [Coniosporium apollinis]